MRHLHTCPSLTTSFHDEIHRSCHPANISSLWLYIFCSRTKDSLFHRSTLSSLFFSSLSSLSCLSYLSLSLSLVCSEANDSTIMLKYTIAYSLCAWQVLAWSVVLFFRRLDVYGSNKYKKLKPKSTCQPEPGFYTQIPIVVRNMIFASLVCTHTTLIEC